MLEDEVRASEWLEGTSNVCVNCALSVLASNMLTNLQLRKIYIAFIVPPCFLKVQTYRAHSNALGSKLAAKMYNIMETL